MAMNARPPCGDKAITMHKHSTILPRAVALLVSIALAHCGPDAPLQGCPVGNECRGATTCTTVANSTTAGASGRLCTIPCTEQNNPCGPRSICVIDPRTTRGVCHQSCDSGPCPIGTACVEVILGSGVCAPPASP